MKIIYWVIILNEEYDDVIVAFFDKKIKLHKNTKI